MTIIDPTSAQVLACPLEAGDLANTDQADASTIGGWLLGQLAELWREGHCRLGDDGPVARALIRAGYVEGEIDGDGLIDRYDDKRADRLIAEAIASMRPAAPAQPETVVLCGSTRFYDAFQQANYELTMAGAIVLSVGFYPHAKAEHGHGEGVGHDSAEKVALDELHLRKIDRADRVYVLDCEVDGLPYVGESTAREIAYARAHGKPITFLSGQDAAPAVTT